MVVVFDGVADVEGLFLCLGVRGEEVGVVLEGLVVVLALAGSDAFDVGGSDEVLDA